MFLFTCLISIVILTPNWLISGSSGSENRHQSARTMLKAMAEDDENIQEYMDALVKIKTNSVYNLTVYVQNSECFTCKLIPVARINYYTTKTIPLSTSYPHYYFTVWKNGKNKTLCENLRSNGFIFGENGVYELDIKDYENDSNCAINVITAASNAYLPLIISFAILIATTLLYMLIRLIVRKNYRRVVTRFNQWRNRSHVLSATSSDDNPRPDIDYMLHGEPLSRRNSARIKSIDTLRGACICVMIFINYGCGGYAILDHVPWNGLHVADLVFPLFMFIMGISIPLSFHKMYHTHTDMLITNKWQPLTRIFRRTFLLFFFGILTSNNSIIDFSCIRIFGILQRFSLCYFLWAFIEILHLYTNHFTYNSLLDLNETSWKAKIKELIIYPFQWMIAFLLTFAWLFITFLLPVPGCPRGYLGPGGLHENGTYENCTGGAAGYLDRLLLGESHLSKYSTFEFVYQTKIRHDSEGLLGFLTSAVLTYMGVCVGHVFVHYREPSRRVIRLAIYAFISGISALLMCKWSKDEGWIPINKNLWSLSFIMAISAIGNVAIICLYALIDVWNVFSGKPFIFPGKNSICIYICHIVFGNFFPVQFKVDEKHSHLLALHIYAVSLWILVSAILDYKSIYISF